MSLFSGISHSFGGSIPRDQSLGAVGSRDVEGGAAKDEPFPKATAGRRRPPAGEAEGRVCGFLKPGKLGNALDFFLGRTRC